MEVLTPRESGKYINDNAKFVTIKEEGIKRLSNVIIEKIKSDQLSTDLFSQATMHPKSTDLWAVDWLFVVDSLNFCFWSWKYEDSWTVDGYSGYFALCAAINRAMREGLDILKPAFYAKITSDEVASILRSDNHVKIPLFDERIQSLHEVGSILLEKFDGSFKTVLQLANKSAVQLLQLIIENFPCFRDEAIYKGRRVTFYKRAQILVGDIWACHKGQGLGEFNDIDQLTMFADYRVPQSLLDFGIFEYTSELLERLKQKQVLPNGDEMEVEIRGCSIHAVEFVVKEINEILPVEKKVNCILLDHFLWDYRKQHATKISKKGLPFHKTYSIYY